MNDRKMLLSQGNDKLVINNLVPTVSLEKSKSMENNVALRLNVSLRSQVTTGRIKAESGNVIFLDAKDHNNNNNKRSHRSVAAGSVINQIY